jgi:hypothetical protein
MLPDFAESYADFIQDDGSVRPAVSLIAEEMTFALDHDGILATTAVVDPHGDTCLLSVIFCMSYGDAQRRMRRKLLPAFPPCFLTVTRKLDEVVGQSGERYSRFIAHTIEAKTDGHAIPVH